MKKNGGISISKCLKSAAKNRRANQTARAILSAPTVLERDSPCRKVYLCKQNYPTPISSTQQPPLTLKQLTPLPACGVGFRIRISLRKNSQIQNGFSLCIWGPDEVCSIGKKPNVKISCLCPFNAKYSNSHCSMM